MIRSKSKDGINAMSGPSYMSSEQKAKYLHDLRNNRPQRPTGARPPPSSFFSARDLPGRSYTPDGTSSSASSPISSDSNPSEPLEVSSRSASAQSHRMSRSNTPSNFIGERGRPVAQPPRRNVSGGTMNSTSSASSTSTYKESGKRSMEKMEVTNLRKAMEDIHMEKEEKIYKNAQDEAAELVWKHQNPNAPYPNPDAPYKYPGLAKKDHSRSQSLGGAEGLQRISSKSKHRHSYTGGLNSQEPVIVHQNGNKSSPLKNADTHSEDEKSSGDIKTSSATQTKDPSRNDSAHDIIEDFRHRRRSSGTKRTPSGSLFRNPEDKIYEEPEEIDPTPKPEPEKAQAPAPVPLQVRRNPFARVKFAVDQLPRSYTDPVNGVKLDKFEIHRNPPSQSRNAGYTLNSPVQTPPRSSDSDETKMKDGKEVRSDDIRAATSLRLKDRSPRLPTPTVVSDKPGRPIVSFKDDWKPREVELKEEKSIFIGKADLVNKEAAPKISANAPLKTASAPVVPTLTNKPSLPKEPALPPIKTFEKYDHTAPPQISSSAPTIGDMPPIPIICAPGDMSKPPIPTISVPEDRLPPSLKIGVRESPSPPSVSINSIPSISVDDGLSNHSKHSSAPEPPKPTNRPLPNPSQVSNGFPRASKTTSNSHWTPTSIRTGVQCNECALPIAGRIVSAAGHRFHPGCFKCYHCAELLECVAFYPEPKAAHDERLSRIQARQKGYDTPTSWPASEEDSDEVMRFYCHLDFHEFFSPRCKSCKTPIEGEVVVACGAEWHVGHFFCAQCGDPFDSKTPFVEKEGYAWCVGCHTNRYSAKCRGCRKPVTDVVVKALGSEWHEGCFVCVECKGPFGDGRYFLRGEEQSPVCVQCEERRLKA